MSDNNKGATNGASTLRLVCNGGPLTAENGIEIKGNIAEIKGLEGNEPTINIPLTPNKERDER